MSSMAPTIIFSPRISKFSKQTRSQRPGHLLDETLKLSEALQPFEGSRISSVSATIPDRHPPTVLPGCCLRKGRTFCSSTQCRHHIQVWPEGQKLPSWWLPNTKAFRCRRMSCVPRKVCNVINTYQISWYYLGDWCATPRCLTWPKARIINSSHVNVSYLTTVFCTSMMLRRLAGLSTCQTISYSCGF